MYDDDNWEIRNLVIEKLSFLTNFDLIDSNNKIRILFIGLSDKNDKVKQNSKRFFKNYLNFLGIITDKKDYTNDNNDDMLIDENDKIMDVTFRTENVKLFNQNHEDSEKKQAQTVDEKIIDATSPSSYESLIELYERIIYHLLSSSNTLSFEQHQTHLNTHAEYDESNNSLLYEILFLQSKR